MTKHPMCNHPELFPTGWNQTKPKPAEMVGSCEHNMICPVCGWGWGSYPCPCIKEEDVQSDTSSQSS